MHSVVLFSGLFLTAVAFLPRTSGLPGLISAAWIAGAAILLPADPDPLGGWDWTRSTSTFISQFIGTVCATGILGALLTILPASSGGQWRTPVLMRFALAGLLLGVVLHVHVITTIMLVGGLILGMIFCAFWPTRLPWIRLGLWLLPGLTAAIVFLPYAAEYLVQKAQGRIFFDLSDQAHAAKPTMGEAAQILILGIGAWSMGFMAAICIGGAILNGRSTRRLWWPVGLAAAATFYLLAIIGIPVSLSPNRQVAPLLAVLLSLTVASAAGMTGRFYGRGAATVSFIIGVWFCSQSLPYRITPNPGSPKASNGFEATLLQSERVACDITIGNWALMEKLLTANEKNAPLAVSYSSAGNWIAALRKKPTYLFHNNKQLDAQWLDQVIIDSRQFFAGKAPGAKVGLIWIVAEDNMFVRADMVAGLKKLAAQGRVRLLSESVAIAEFSLAP
jgi:hypothetical protein